MSKFKTGSTSASTTLVRKQKRHNTNKTSSSLLAFTILGFLSTGDYKQSGAMMMMKTERRRRRRKKKARKRTGL
jgi:hypothetical protein